MSMTATPRGRHGGLAHPLILPIEPHHPPGLRGKRTKSEQSPSASAAARSYKSIGPVSAPTCSFGDGARTRSSAGPATNDSGAPWTLSRSPPANGIHGRQAATPAPGTAGTTTAALCAPPDERSAESCGAAGRPERPMTPPATPDSNNTSPSSSPARRAPGPTKQPPNAWPPTTPVRQPHRPEVDTGRLSSPRPAGGDARLATTARPDPSGRRERAQGRRLALLTVTPYRADRRSLVHVGGTWPESPQARAQ